MTVAGYQINFDALLARMVYRWHWRIALGVVAVAAVIGVAAGIVPPFWRGAAALAVSAPVGATITVDRKPWPRPLYAGVYRVAAHLPDGRTSWADVSFTAGLTTSLTLPPGLPEPRERVLPPPAPGFAVEQVWWADGGWRVRSRPMLAEEDDAATAETAPTSEPAAQQVVAVTENGFERLAMIDAYGGLADQGHRGETPVEAVFVPDANGYSGRAGGTVEVRGWSAALDVITVTQPVTMLRFSPAGDALLLAEQTPAGEQVSLVRREGEREVLVAVPGRLTRVSWRDDGTALVLHSREREHLTLTLVRLAPTTGAAVIAELDAAHYPGDVAPLAWDARGLLWIAPESSGASALWQASLANLLPERVVAMDAQALTVLPDGDVRVLMRQDGVFVIGRFRRTQFIGETVLTSVLAEDHVVGVWQGNDLLLQSRSRAWLLDTGAVREKDR
jgi:hypothetical protein